MALRKRSRLRKPQAVFLIHWTLALRPLASLRALDAPLDRGDLSPQLAPATRLSGDCRGGTLARWSCTAFRTRHGTSYYPFISYSPLAPAFNNIPPASVVGSDHKDHFLVWTWVERRVASECNPDSVADISDS